MKTGIIPFAMLCVPVIAFSATIYVPDHYSTIQGAIDASANGDTIIVRAGAYTELINFSGKAITVISEQGASVTAIDGNQLGSVVTFASGEGSDSVLEGFTIRNGLGGIYCNGASPSIRKIVITDNDSSGLYCHNSFPVVEHTVFSDNGAIYGGGIYNYESSPIVTDCSFIDNEVYKLGGGMYNEYYSSPVVIDCTFSGNIAHGLFGSGGGMYNEWYCNPTVTNCLFFNNTTPGVGGGIRNYRHCSPTITGCTFSHNEAGSGGGIDNEQSSSTVTNCIFNLNHAVNSGGGLRDYWFGNSTITNCFFLRNGSDDHGGGGLSIIGSDPTITNCTFSENSTLSVYKGGGGLSTTGSSEPTIVNAIFWNNHAPEGPEIWIGTSGSVVTIAFSDVKGGQSSVHIEPGCTLNWGAGMIDADPLFVQPGGNDFHLTYSSPCKDTGDILAVQDLYDFEGDPRIAYEIVDMGADEFYTHLYCTGNFTPGGSIKGKFVGLPGTSPVGLFLGFDVLDPPVPTAWGNFHLQAPWSLIPMVPIPGDGVLVVPEKLPASPAAPYDVPMQALVGLDSDSLTNLFVLEVR
ncbi:MAG: right-handed parallel beta-helix repeat-containing protein [Planctomycetota bacterium]|jgi:hypothetical protein